MRAPPPHTTTGMSVFIVLHVTAERDWGWGGGASSVAKYNITCKWRRFVSPSGGDLSSAAVHLPVPAAHRRSISVKVSIQQKELSLLRCPQCQREKWEQTRVSAPLNWVAPLHCWFVLQKWLFMVLETCADVHHWMVFFAERINNLLLSCLFVFGSV